MIFLILKSEAIIYLSDTICMFILFLSKDRDHGIWSHHFMASRWGNNGNSDRLYFLGLQNNCMVTAAVKLKDTCSLEEKL